MILRAGDRGRGLAQQILTFSRPVARELRDVRIGPLLDEVAGFLKPALPANVELRVRAEPDLPTVRADVDQLHRVLVNLGTNAWQAMRPKGGVLEIRAAAVASAAGLPPGPAVRIDVRDEGCGMDARTRAHIFEPFFSTKPPGEGTGLGLAVVHGIVRAHGGTVIVDSTPGRGSTFSVFLPLTAPDATPRVPVREADGSPLPARILYVDDDEALLLLAEHALRRAGYSVTTCARPAEAIEAFRSAPEAYDLVLTDQRMPGMLGEELLVALRKIRCDIPVVLISGYVTPEFAARVRTLGASDVLEKPMSIDELVDLVRRTVGRVRAPARSPVGS
jgi:CheY-like chemotaxis protein